MPKLRAATAPKTSPIAVVITSARTSARVGSQPRVRPFDLPAGAALGDHVPEEVSRDADEGRLGEGDHAAVGEQEDEARRGDPEDERLGQDRVHPVVVEDHRPEREEQEQGDADAPLRGRFRVQPRAHPALPKSPCGRNASTSAIRTKVRTIEYCVQQLSLVDRQVRGREGEDERVEQGARRPRPSSDPMPPTITTTSEFSSHCAVLARGDVALRGADDRSEGRQRGADDERDRERLLDVDPERRGHLRSSTPARITMPVFVR